MRLTDYKDKVIHFIAIGGCSMSGLAVLLGKMGFKYIQGSDSAQTKYLAPLREMGMKIFIGHDAAQVENAELVVYSAAIGENNCELKRARELGVPVLRRDELLGFISELSPNCIGVAGTHGKTTTTGMIAQIFEEAGRDPVIHMGGTLPLIGSSVKLGHGGEFITEACEYVDSFLTLHPSCAIVLNIDADHLDYFKDIDHIVNSFDKFASLVPEDGLIVAYEANPFVNKVIKGLKNVVTFGLNEKCNYYAKDIVFNESGMPSFDVENQGRHLCRIQLSIPGEHNILNALAAFACCHSLGVEVAVIKETLENYHGTQRRFDIVGTTEKGVKIVDDYAHHPTEIKATLTACQNIPHNKLWCLFQPHTYTRTMALFDEFAGAFEKADVLVLAEIYAAREKNIYKISSQQLAESIKKAYPDKEVIFMDDFHKIADHVCKNAQSGDLVLTMGAGDIYKVGEMILEN